MEQDLEIAKIHLAPGRQPGLVRGGGSARGSSPTHPPEMRKPRQSRLHRRDVVGEELAKQEETLLARQLAGGARSDVEERVGQVAFGVGVELVEEGGNEVEGLPDRREAPRQRRQVEVVLQGVQAHPRERRAPLRDVHVVGLVHVPEEGDAEAAHGPQPKKDCARA